MHEYMLSHVSDEALLRGLAALVGQDRLTTAKLLAHIAEVDVRRLYVPAGYPSMHAYCVEELRLSEDAAYKRIQAARAARQFPQLLTALAEGRLHLAAVCLLAPHLTAKNSEELVEAATHRRKAEIDEFLALQFPVGRAPAMVRVVSAVPVAELASASVASKYQLALGQVGSDRSVSDDQLAPGQVGEVQEESPLPSSERFFLQLPIEARPVRPTLRPRGLRTRM